MSRRDAAPLLLTLLVSLVPCSAVYADEQVIAPGTGLQSSIVVDTGTNGLCETTAVNGDIQAAPVGGATPNRTEVRCDIHTTSAKPPTKRPKSCDGEWGDAFSVRPRGKGTGVCHGDTALPVPGQKVRILKYGTSIRFGTLVCTSRTSGLTCHNAGNHGFFMSREKLRVF